MMPDTSKRYSLKKLKQDLKNGNYDAVNRQVGYFFDGNNLFVQPSRDVCLFALNHHDCNSYLYCSINSDLVKSTNFDDVKKLFPGTYFDSLADVTNLNRVEHNSIKWITFAKKRNAMYGVANNSISYFLPMNTDTAKYVFWCCHCGDLFTTPVESYIRFPRRNDLLITPLYNDCFHKCKSHLPNIGLLVIGFLIPNVLRSKPFKKRKLVLSCLDKYFFSEERLTLLLGESLSKECKAGTKHILRKTMFEVEVSYNDGLITTDILPEEYVGQKYVNALNKKYAKLIIPANVFDKLVRRYSVRKFDIASNTQEIEAIDEEKYLNDVAV